MVGEGIWRKEVAAKPPPSPVGITDLPWKTACGSKNLTNGIGWAENRAMPIESFYEYLAKFPPHLRGKVLRETKEINGLNVEIPEIEEIIKRIASAPHVPESCVSSEKSQEKNRTQSRKIFTATEKRCHIENIQGFQRLLSFRLGGGNFRSFHKTQPGNLAKLAASQDSDPASIFPSFS